jgi:hypothetical protein
VTTVLGIDPGPAESAFARIDLTTRRPLQFGKRDNDWLRDNLTSWASRFYAIEMIAHYGMPAGAELFETCVWIGRFAETIRRETNQEPGLVLRPTVKAHHCHSTRAKDSNMIQALRDRFAPGVGNYGKGYKDAPGFFYDFSKDAWQAYALAVYIADTMTEETTT